MAALLPSSPPVWAFGGSRSLSAEASALATSAARDLLRSECRLVVGCCTGADASALSAAVGLKLAERVSVFAAFGALGPVGHCPLGTCAVSAVVAVRAAVRAGATFQPWAGGSASVALSARLSARTLAVARACTAGAVVFLSPASRGALILARAVAHRGLPVIAFPLLGAKLPVLASGCQWSPAASTGFWSAGFIYLPNNPAQHSLPGLHLP